MSRAAILVAMLSAASAHAAPLVFGQRSHWDAAHRYIWSDLDVMHEDGRLEVVRAPGGSVDGIAMRQFMQWGAAGPPVVRYVPQVTTQSHKRMRWRSGCVYLTPDARGSNDVPGDEEFRVLRRVVEHWESATASCGFLKFRRNAPYVGDVGYDAINRIIFREDAWCPPGIPAGDKDCYPAAATAITTVFHVDNPARSDDGQIIDTDIELNSVDYAMASGCESNCQTSGSGDVEDLENTLTHEVGHVIGLDHPCWSPPQTAPLDGDGNPAPMCDPVTSLPSDITEATMFPRQAPEEIKKRTLEAEDIKGLCDLYPASQDPESCEPIVMDDGGCVITPVDESSPWDVVFLFGLVAITARACSRNRRR